ncbi:MFS transporter [Streptomyces sp. A1499]|uniref:MFS transporter n=1 Tax=Streptomyces sp. A1499 TaxID=2563104 RepID=UPI00109E766D|nr:MFS transporter [Streptomyces sp. A1499]THC55152.1 MFS transporter [Streptomyces sp. A1499]
MVSMAAEPDPRRWKALVFICLAELMVVLDGTIVNIALPSAQQDLHFSDADRQWVVTAYALAFGGLLLFGGRVADLWNRRHAFLLGAVGFAAASAVGGAAVNTAMLMGSRAVQGAFAALLAPAALSLLSVMFTRADERAKAFGVYGAIAGAGAAIGLLLGGVLTEYLTWRWTLLINIAFSAVAALGVRYVADERGPGRRGRRPDLPGAVLATGGLVCLVYGLTRAESDGWAAPVTLSLLGVAVVLLAVFVVLEARAPEPLLPLRVVLDRNRGGAYLCLAVVFVGMFGLFLFLTFYLQRDLGFSPLVCGAAFLPLTVGIMIGATLIGTRLAPLVPARPLITAGFLVGASGLVVLAQITPTGSYTTVVLPGMFVMGLGLGTVLMPAVGLATHAVTPRDAGVASAMVTTAQQIGCAVGTALLNTVAATATAAHLREHPPLDPATALDSTARATVHGYSTAMWCAAGILAVVGVAAAALIDHRPRTTAARPADEGGDGHRRTPVREAGPS